MELTITRADASNPNIAEQTRCCRLCSNRIQEDRRNCHSSSCQSDCKWHWCACTSACTGTGAAQIAREATRLSTGRRIRICILTKARTAAAQNDPAALGTYALIVSTPMRLVSVLRAKAICLSTVELLVFDEADKLFETAFIVS